MYGELGVGGQQKEPNSAITHATALAEDEYAGMW